MIEQDHVNVINCKFKAQRDFENLNNWEIVTNKWKGDCEYYSLTLLWIASDRKLIQFLVNLFSKNISFHKAILVDGEHHFVLECNGKFIDNIQNKFFELNSPRIMKNYKFISKYYKTTVLINILTSAFKRKYLK
jgi:hypothetical protein